MRKRHKFTRDEVIALHARYLESGLSLKGFAEREDIAHNLWYWFKMHGLQGRSKDERYKIQAKNQRGAGNWNWSGGKTISPDGYVILRRARTDDDPNPKPVREHKQVWESVNGPLPSGWHIHHINGIKTDNRIENLEAMPARDHYLYIPRLKRKIEEQARKLKALNVPVDFGVVDY